MDKATAETLLTRFIVAHELLNSTDTIEVVQGSKLENYRKRKDALIEALTRPPVVEANPQGEKFICLGCGDLDAEIITESDPTGLGDGDEICKKCGGGDFCDSVEGAIKELILSCKKLHDANFEMQGKMLDVEIAARVPPDVKPQGNGDGYNDSPDFLVELAKQRTIERQGLRAIIEALKGDTDKSELMALACDALDWKADRVPPETPSKPAKPLHDMPVIPRKPDEPLHEGLLEASKAVMDWYRERPDIKQSVFEKLNKAIEAQGK